MIIGPAAYESRWQQKFTLLDIVMVELVVPSRLRWFNSTITLDHIDHPDHIPQLGRFQLIVDPIIRGKCPSRVLMDGGSRLNILYSDTLNSIGITCSRI